MTQTDPRAPVVLVVDDDPGVRQFLEFALGRRGFGVLLAQDGREAVALYRADPASVDVALVDVTMPGLDGPQTLAALRDVDADLPAAFMSGGWACHEAKEFGPLSAVPRLSKPFALDAVVGALHLLLAG